MRPHHSLPFLTLAVVASHGCARSEAQMTKASVPPVEGRGPIELTVYSGDFGMVREVRQVRLAAGHSRVGLQGVSRAMDQNSVLFTWPQGQETHVVSSTYDLGIGNSERLLNRFLGQTVELVYRGDNGQAGERVSGILEVADPGNVVVRSGDRYIVNPDATIEAPANTGIVTLPQLSAEVESKSGGATSMALTYMTEGLSWTADYTATLDANADRLGLECWATVTNRTGADYPDAKISFVAGAPNRAARADDEDARSRTLAGQTVLAARALPRDVPVAKPEQMGELYAYPYQTTATVKQDQLNRVRMMGSDAVRVKRFYGIALPPIYREYSELTDSQRLTATMGINFTNAASSGLGQPLPAGAVRVYEPDESGTPRYVGAADLGNIPKGDRASLTLTEAFDVYARARQVSAEQIDKRHTRRTVEVTLFNAKKKPVEVNLSQYFESPWRIEKETAPSGKLGGNTNGWKVTIPAGGKRTLRYTVRFGR